MFLLQKPIEVKQGKINYKNKIEQDRVKWLHGQSQVIILVEWHGILRLVHLRLYMTQPQ